MLPETSVVLGCSFSALTEAVSFLAALLAAFRRAASANAAACLSSFGFWLEDCSTGALAAISVLMGVSIVWLPEISISGLLFILASCSAFS